jgi:peptidoglycan/xylan/chitin deacetylase (PgdA/CDA1 family)
MGSVVISVDAELGWGFHDWEEPPERRVEAARDGWETLLELCSTYDVPATWAVVGHLFLDDCDCYHADHPSIPGWFERERGAWADRPDLRFGPELIDAIRESSPDHEIASHTFSHVVFDDPRATREILDAELAKAVEIAAENGIEYDSFVFPRNAVCARDLLAEHGFTAYRGERTPRPDGFARAASKLADVLRPERLPIHQPTVDEHGLVDVPPSLYLFGFEGLPRKVFSRVWTDPVVRQARHGIARAATEDGVFHLWLHPNNLTTDRDRARMEAVLASLVRHRAESGLRVETMREVAERTRRDSESRVERRGRTVV